MNDQEQVAGQTGVRQYAQLYRKAGLQVMPICGDGSKRPKMPKWAHLQDPKEHCSLDHFSGEDVGIAIICGMASGGLEVIDFDDPSLYCLWCEQVEETYPGLIQRLVVIETPRANEEGEHGKHVAYRCPHPAGSLKLAYCAPDGSGKCKTAIETKGEGGYVLAPGSPACCHPTGCHYEALQGNYYDVPAISHEERVVLHGCARALDKKPPRGDQQKPHTPGVKTDHDASKRTNKTTPNSRSSSKQKSVVTEGVKRAAAGRWREIICALCHIDPALLDARHHACPRCGGKDRFRAFDDFDETGGCLCNQCHRQNNADGLSTVQWLNDTDFKTALHEVADYLGPESHEHGKPRNVITYDYKDERGKLLYQVCRYEPKEFRQRRPDKQGGWIWNVKGTRRVLYRLPELLAEPGRPAVVVEGEKDVENLNGENVLATCCSNGAEGWQDKFAYYFVGRCVAILPDSDEKGFKFAETVAHSLHGIAKAVRVVNLPQLAEAEDVSDWLEKGGTGNQLKQLIINAADWSPGNQVAPGGPEQPCYEPFPTEVLPTPIRRYAEESALDLSCDASFVVLPLLAALASAVGNTRRVKLKQKWTEPCVIWSVIVGQSGSLKSPALERGIDPIQQRQKKALSEHKNKEKQYKKDKLLFDADMQHWKNKGREKGEPPPEEPAYPAPPRFLCSDVTVEAIAVVLEENPNGLLLARDELSGWLSSFDAYKQTRGADVGHWLSMHRAGALQCDRKTGKRLTYVPRAAVSIAGSIQPEVLKLAIGGRDDDEKSVKEHLANGLTSRLLFACPPIKEKRWSDNDVSDQAINEIEHVFDELFGLEPAVESADSGQKDVPFDLPLSPAARECFVDFYNEHARETVKLEQNLAAAWSKLEGYAARFALLFQLIEDPDAKEVSLAALQKGIEISRWFADEATRVYRLLEATSETAEARQTREHERLIEWITKQGGHVTERKLQQAGPRKYRNKKKAEEALQSLVNAKRGHWRSVNPDGPGRPSREFVLGGDETPKSPPKTEVSFPSPSSPEQKDDVKQDNNGYNRGDGLNLPRAERGNQKRKDITLQSLATETELPKTAQNERFCRHGDLCEVCGAQLTESPPTSDGHVTVQCPQCDKSCGASVASRAHADSEVCVEPDRCVDSSEIRI